MVADVRASVVVFAGVLAFASARAWWLPEAVAAVPGAAAVLALGLVSWHDAVDERAALGATVGFLVAVLVLATPGGPTGIGPAGALGLSTAAFVAAVLANLVNNLPATLMLVPLVAHSPGLVLAVLLGVNIGRT